MSYNRSSHLHLFKLSILMTAFSSFMVSCSQLVETDPDNLTDTSDVVITCDASKGNKGLLNYTGDVYVHIGLITNKSVDKVDWRYIKFSWGSTEPEALATPAGKNKWAYTIKNIREFFGVDPDEQILNLAILFRSGACLDIYCKVLRNADNSDLYIPIHDQSVTAME